MGSNPAWSFFFGVIVRGTVYQITLPYATAGIIVEHERVAVAAPIVGWMRGKHMNEVKSWVQGRQGTIVVVPREAGGGLG